MSIFLGFFVFLFHNAIPKHQCPLDSCQDDSLGNFKCDPVCNNYLCNFDSFVQYDESDIEIFSASDCFPFCLSTSCTVELLTNDQCDEECNNFYCAYDLGICGICNSDCTEKELLNEKCDKDSPCNTEYCEYDAKQCNICVEGCGKSDISKKTCENEICKDRYCYYIPGNPCGGSIDLCSNNCLYSQVGNGVCDADCTIKSCNYDNNDCDCAPGCTREEKLRYCKGLNDPCFNYGCYFKRFMCYGLECSPGCLIEMVNNLVCNEECLTPECGYDATDCYCKPGCPYFPIGDDLILNPLNHNTYYCGFPSCWYSILDNNDDFTKRKRILGKLMFDHFNFFYANSLPDGCDEADLRKFDSLDGERCDISSPCYSRNAFWCMGRSNDNMMNCLRSMKSGCVICDGLMVDGDCMPNLTSCPDGTYANSMINKLFSINSTKLIWCLSRSEEIDSYTELYVKSSTYSDYSGSGSKESPFLSLYQAFYSVSSTHTRIKLFPGDFIYKYEYFTSFDSRLNGPLKSNDLNTLIIESIDPQNPSVIYWTNEIYNNSDFLTIQWHGERIIIKNIEFNGKYILNYSSNIFEQKDYNYYCPNFILISDPTGVESLINDRNEIFDNNNFVVKLNKSSECLRYSNYIFFNFTGAGMLFNVTFKNFRNQFKNIIMSSNILVLQNVSFYKMQPNKDGTVIKIECKEDCYKVYFTYFNGIVEDLNFGYEINDRIQTAGFLDINGTYSVKLMNIKFTFNLVYSSPGLMINSALIRISVIYETILIDNCVFNNIYANILIDIYASIQVNRMIGNLDVEGEYINFQLSNSSFQHIYTSSNLIRHTSTFSTNNIKILDINFTSVNSASSSIISLIFKEKLSKIDTIGGYDYNEFKDLVYFYKRNTELYRLNFIGVRTGEFIIYIERNPNVSLKDIKIYDFYDGNRDSVSLIIENFRKNNKYLSVTPRSDQIGDLRCSGSIKIIETFRVNIENTLTHKSACYFSDAPSGFIFEKISNSLNLNAINFTFIESSSTSGSLLSFNDIDIPIRIQNLYMSQVNNSAGASVEFFNCKFIKISNLQAYFSNVNSSAFISVTNFISFSINDIISNSITNYFGTSGFLYAVVSRESESTLDIQNVFTEGLLVYGGDSGIFMIDSYSGAKSHNIYIRNVTFKRVSASQGVFLYISKRLSINDSFISEIRGTENSNSISMIYDLHFNGVLRFSDVEFTNNYFISNPGILTDYQGAGPLIELSKFTIANSTGADIVFQFIGKSSESIFLSFSNVSVCNISSYHSTTYASAMKLNGVNLAANGFEVSYLKNVALILNGVLEITNGNFHHLTEYFIKSQDKGVFRCSICDINNNFGTLLSLSGGSYLTISESQIYDNICQGPRSSLIEIDSSGIERNIFYKTVIKNNKSINNYIIGIFDTKLDILYSDYSDNFDRASTSNCIVTYASDIFIENSIFSLNIQTPIGSYIYSSLLGNLTVINSIFLNGYSESNGGAITLVQSNFAIIDGCIFKNNTSLKEGGALKVLKTSTTISNSIFQENSALQGSDLYFSESNLSITSTTFERSRSQSFLQQFSLYISSGKLSLNQGNIFNLEQNVSALFCFDLREVLIKDSLICNITGNENGAIFCDGGASNGIFMIKNSILKNNLSYRDGGALYLSDMNLIINDTSISLNKAFQDAGGIFFESRNCKNCIFHVTGKTEIVENQAERNGGGIRWLNSKPQVDSNAIILNNSAEYGKNIAGVQVTLDFAGRNLNQVNISIDKSAPSIRPLD